MYFLVTKKMNYIELYFFSKLLNFFQLLIKFVISKLFQFQSKDENKI